MRGRNHIYKCQICYPFDTVVIKKMTNMLLVHEKKKTFKCKVCDLHCFSKTNLKRYVKLVHERKK